MGLWSWLGFSLRFGSWVGIGFGSWLRLGIGFGFGLRIWLGNWLGIGLKPLGINLYWLLMDCPRVPMSVSWRYCIFFKRQPLHVSTRPHSPRAITAQTSPRSAIACCAVTFWRA